MKFRLFLVVTVAFTLVLLSNHLMRAAALSAAGRGRGGALRIRYWQAPAILNAHLSRSTAEFDAARPVLEPLATFGSDGSPIPLLAAQVPSVANGGISPDLTTITWTLKTGLQWSDGIAFSAADVVFTYDYCADPQTACTTAGAFAHVASVSALNPSSVKVVWQSPNADPFQMFVGTRGAILPQHQFASCIGANAHTAPACQAANLAPVGTGPYQVEQFVPGDTVTYTINAHYRDPDKPFFQRVLRDGTADYAWNLQVDPATLQSLLSLGNGGLLAIPGSGVERLLLNRADPDPLLGPQRSEPSTTHPFLSDLRVRQALALVMDRPYLAKLYGAGGAPTCELVVTLPYISPTEVYGGRNHCAPDGIAAGQLLTDAGWLYGNDSIRQKNGVRLHILFRTTTNALRQQEQAVIAELWQTLGVETVLTSTSPVNFFSTDPGNPNTAAHFYADVEMFSNGYAAPDPGTYLCGWTTAQIAQSSNQWSGANFERFSDAHYDQLCAQLATETNTANRQSIVLNMNDTLVQDVVDIPLVVRLGGSGYANYLKGLDANPWESELWNIADWYRTHQQFLPLLSR